MNDVEIVLTLYGREGCHLCEIMLHDLQKWQEHRSLSVKIDVVDIDSEDELIARYAARIPVLVADTTEVCQYYLDQSALDCLFKDSL